jgi:hypothetical protein
MKVRSVAIDWTGTWYFDLVNPRTMPAGNMMPQVRTCSAT